MRKKFQLSMIECFYQSNFSQTFSKPSSFKGRILVCLANKQSSSNNGAIAQPTVTATLKLNNKFPVRFAVQSLPPILIAFGKAPPYSCLAHTHTDCSSITSAASLGCQLTFHGRRHDLRLRRCGLWELTGWELPIVSHGLLFPSRGACALAVDRQ